MKLGRILAIATGVVVGLVVVLLLASLAVPSNVHIQRTTTIDRPACTVAAYLGDLRRFNTWSPWAKIDPNAQYTWEGAAGKVGQKMTWTSEDDNVGNGAMTITALQGCERVDIDLDFGPMGIAKSWHEIVAKDGKSEVTWHFENDMGLNPIAKGFGLMMDGLLGPDYEKGLVGLKTEVEKLPAADFYELRVDTVNVIGSQALMVHVESAKDVAAVGQALGIAYGQIGEYAPSQRLVQSGPPFALTTSQEGDKYVMEVGYPVQDAPKDVKKVPPAPANSPVRLGISPQGRAAKVVHVGSYASMDATHEKLQAWLAFHKLEKTGALWEVYVSDPGTTPEAELKTEIYYPVSK